MESGFKNMRFPSEDSLVSCGQKADSYKKWFQKYPDLCGRGLRPRFNLHLLLTTSQRTDGKFYGFSNFLIGLGIKPRPRCDFGAFFNVFKAVPSTTARPARTFSHQVLVRVGRTQNRL